MKESRQKLCVQAAFSIFHTVYHFNCYLFQPIGMVRVQLAMKREIYMYICISILMYTYMHISMREREGEREGG